MVDVKPSKLVLTWQNFRSIEEAISKRLDHFLVSESLLESHFLMKPWVGSGGLSDHLTNSVEIGI
jgi:hypothetical protein